jgi:hypothetical protein
MSPICILFIMRRRLFGQMMAVALRQLFEHVPNLHIIMRHRLFGQMMAVVLRQLVASTSSILIWGSVWRFP